MDKKEFNRKNNPNFYKLFDLNCFAGRKIYATTKNDLVMNVWKGHDSDPKCETHICKSGTKVQVWMASRFGDVGVTDNLDNPSGYHCRCDADLDLENIEGCD